MTSQARGNGFDPSSRLSTLDDGTQYLGARDRLLWFLREQEEFAVTSQVERMSNALVIVKVTVAIQGGKKVEALGSAPTNGDYPAVETAETHALGRALALLGYGTESALELDTRTLVDSPTRAPKQGATETQGDEHQKDDGDGHDGSVARLPAWATLIGKTNGDGLDGKTPPGTGGKPENGDGASAAKAGGAPAKGNSAARALTCADCQGPIKEGKTRDGTVLAADEVAERARKQCGRPLCARCLVKHMAQSKPKEGKEVKSA